VILCLCRGVSDHTVLSLLAGGVDGLDGIRQRCGAGEDCGTCRDLLEALIERAREQRYQGARA
jgi:bacterioferritin-associated ferredoxin